MRMDLRVGLRIYIGSRISQFFIKCVNPLVRQIQNATQKVYTRFQIFLLAHCIYSTLIKFYSITPANLGINGLCALIITSTLLITTRRNTTYAPYYTYYTCALTKSIDNAITHLCVSDLYGLYGHRWQLLNQHICTRSLYLNNDHIV
jgi:hypothetical protein